MATELFFHHLPLSRIWKIWSLKAPSPDTNTLWEESSESTTCQSLCGSTASKKAHHLLQMLGWMKGRGKEKSADYARDGHTIPQA